MQLPTRLPLEIRLKISAIESVAPVIVVRLLRHDRLDYCYMSEALASALGYDAARLTELGLEPALPDSGYIEGAIRDRIAAVHFGGRVSATEVPMRAMDGRLIVVPCLMMFLRVDGEAIAIGLVAMPQVQSELAFEPIPDRCHGFISYARKDIPPNLPENFSKPRELQRLAARRGLNLWLDVRSMPLSRPFKEEIERSIAASDRLLFFAGRYSAVSSWCRMELDTALRYGKQVLVIKIDDGGELVLNERQWRFLYPDRAKEWEGKAAVGENRVSATTNELLRRRFPELMDLNHHDWANNRVDVTYGTAITALMDAIVQSGDQPARQTALLLKALAWSEADRAKSMLLVGNELQDAISLVALDGQPNHMPAELLDYVSSSLAARQGGAHAFVSGDDGTLARSIRRAGLAAWQSRGLILDVDRASYSQRRIDRAGMFVLVGSRASLANAVSQAELTYALRAGKPIVVALMDADVAFAYDQELGPGLIVHFDPYPDIGLAQLIAILNKDIAHKLHHGQLLIAERRSRDTGMLLPPIDAAYSLRQFTETGNGEPRLNAEMLSFLGRSRAHGRIVGLPPVWAGRVIVGLGAIVLVEVVRLVVSVVLK